MVHDDDVRECLRRLQERMEVRGLRPATMTVYTRCVRRFVLHVGKALEDVRTEEVQQYLPGPWTGETTEELLELIHDARKRDDAPGERPR